MSQPFLPQPIEELHKRYAAALERVFSPADARAGTPILRENIFDSWDGYRLVITVNEERPGFLLLHVSANRPLRSWCQKLVGQGESLRLFHQISGRSDCPIHILSGTPGFVHMFFPVKAPAPEPIAANPKGV